MTERGTHEIEHSLTGIKVELATLRQEFHSHIDQVDDIVNSALMAHELREVAQQKTMLISTIRSIMYGLIAVASTIGGVSWWFIQRWIETQ